MRNVKALFSSLVQSRENVILSEACKLNERAARLTQVVSLPATWLSGRPKQSVQNVLTREFMF